MPAAKIAWNSQRFWLMVRRATPADSTCLSPSRLRTTMPVSYTHLYEIYELILQLAKQGKAVMMVSTSLYILRSQTHDGFLLIFNTAEVLAAFEDTGHMAVAHNKDAVADPDQFRHFG